MFWHDRHGSNPFRNAVGVPTGSNQWKLFFRWARLEPTLQLSTEVAWQVRFNIKYQEYAENSRLVVILVHILWVLKYYEFICKYCLVYSCVYLMSVSYFQIRYCDFDNAELTLNIVIFICFVYSFNLYCYMFHCYYPILCIFLN